MNNSIRYPHLFAPIQLGSTIFRNRIFSAPTGLYNMVTRGNPSEGFIAYFARKARGGAASINIGECYVDDVGLPKEDDSVQINSSIILSDRLTARCGLGKLADSITRQGAVATLELNKCGMLGTPDKNGEGVYGPCEGTFEWAGGHFCRAMTDEQIFKTVDAFANAADYAKRLGYGMVTVHAGHGWLLHQFLSPTINKRTDRWGGNPENRARFAVMVCDAIHAKCGAGFPVEVRMSGSELHEGGYGIEEGVKIAKQLDGHANLIHISVGNIFVDMSPTHPNMFYDEGCNVKFAAEIKKHVKTPVATVGSLGDPEMLEEIIASGKADVVEMARSLICDPDLPNKAREGREDELFRCMRCFYCVSRDQLHGHLFCALNPESGREWEINVALPPAKTQSVLVVGGGIAGMQAALTASELGHKVILCEKTGQLGGIILCEENVPFKKRIGRYIERQKNLLSKSNVDIHMNTEVTPEYAKSLEPDTIIAAVGSIPSRPPIPGIDLPNVIDAEDAFVNPASVAESAVIIGAGSTGIELALYLQSLARQVEIIEAYDAVTLANTANRSMTLDGVLEKAGIAVNYNTKAAEISEQGVRCETADGERFIGGKTVILAIGQKALSETAQVLSPCAERFYQIGDCRSPRNIAAATSEGWSVARSIGRY